MYIMEHGYDEDVSLNQFLIFLCKHYENSFYEAIQNEWLICIPREGSFSKNIYSELDINDHILKPRADSNLNFDTLSGHQVSINNKTIKCNVENKTRTVNILFIETCYTEDGLSYKIICIDGPLTSSSTVEDIIVIKSVRDCSIFLYSKNNKVLLKDLRFMIDTFLVSNDFSNMHIDEKKKKINILYKKCFKRACDYFKHRGNFFRDNIKLVIEYYILNKLYTTLITDVNIYVANEDAMLNKLIQNYSNVQLDLEVDKDTEVVIPSARCELSKLNIHKSIIGKYKCLKDTFLMLSNGNEHFSVDNLLNALVNLILHCKISNWNAQIHFMKHFTMSGIKEYDDNFYLTCLEAAIEHIKTYNFKIELYINSNDSKFNNLYNLIRNGDYQKIKELLNYVKSQKSNLMCHPLCECDSCMKQIQMQPIVCVNFKDDQGLTPLHIAAFYGNPLVIELLLKYESDINALDNFMRTPVHYAALRGHQNALLFLLHNKAIMSGDNEGNTPLHLCCLNSHEACVKALLYFMEFSDLNFDINVQNNQGNTSLHLCFKWGYSNIVEILLEHKGDPTLCNRRGQTCLDCAHNLKMINMFSALKKNSIECVRKRSVEVINLQRVIDKILTAITDGDIRLAQYYLKIEDENHCTNECMFVNSANIKGYTPLHIAAMYGQNSILNMLIKHGADINAETNSDKFTPLHLAVQNFMHKSIIILLSTKKCDINKQDSSGSSALHYACSNGCNVDIIVLLLKNGGDLGVINNMFTSALDILNKNSELRQMVLMKQKVH
ncbi:ankyrin repeat domain-containing protein 27-like isoform X2 [Daktulosphaira vitifoliae]|uniref:ankyrin repeat domain-containing protein 27-like isoform X2 n=1 Tax=Daktulosphaira vitifoliae TaxID=58002 RepID=UPI0021AA2F7F|nr:ankyrin repeat domain-containing protein 27-like isoform X2 [Daktulosphaira vitifoliae]